MKYWAILLILCSAVKVYPQNRLLEHPAALKVVRQGLYHIYNAEAQKAENYILEVEKLMPQHPVAPMMRALNTNWSSNPIETDSPEFRKLMGYLQISEDRTKALLDAEPKHMEAVFFAMAINSWLAQFYDEDGHTWKALGAAKRAYYYMKIGFDMLDLSPEFYFSTGLYNYYRVQYPESNPVYKPFMWFFRNGDKALGLKQLDHASENATFTQAEAAMYLAHLNLRYEQKPLQAVKYSHLLVDRYPNNVFFKINYVEALLVSHNYPTALPIIQKLTLETKDFYRMSGEIFYGIYLEQYAKDLQKAKKWYQKALDTGETLGRRADNKKSLAYAGLARLADNRGETDLARSHYRTAIKLAQYDTVKNEAKAYLRQN